MTLDQANLKSLLAFHGPWLGVLLLALSLSLGLHQGGRIILAQKQTQIQALQKETKIAQMSRQQIDEDARKAKEIQENLTPAQRETLLKPADRRAFTLKLKELAHATRLAHFTFTLGAPVMDEATATQTATLSFEADAPLDSDAISFLNRLQTAAPGKITWKSLRLSRLSNKLGLAPLNLHLSAEALWLAPTSPNSYLKGNTP